MSLEALERTLRVRVRAFFRRTRLVIALGAIILGGLIWAALHLTLAPTQMRVAAGPPGSADVKFVEMLSGKVAAQHAKVQFHLVATDGPRASAAALTAGEADLAVLPSTLADAPDWPVVAILRKNVMALVVPTQPPPAPAKKEPPPAKEAGAAEGNKSGTADTGSKGAGNESSDKADKSDKTAKNNEKTTQESPDKNADKTSTKVAAAKTGDKTGHKTTDKNVDEAADTNAENDADKDDKAGSEVAAANKLDSVAKLAGHRIGVVTGNAATPEVLGVVLGHCGVLPNQVQISLIEPNRIAEAAKAREVDVLFVAGAETGQAINDVVAAATINGRAPSFIPIDQAEGMAKCSPAFQSIDVAAGTFGGTPPAPPDDLKSLFFPNIWWRKNRFTMTRSARWRS